MNASGVVLPLHPAGRPRWPAPRLVGGVTLALAAGLAAAQPPAESFTTPGSHLSSAEAAPLESRFADMRLLLCFMGKGSSLPYDAGVLHEAYARIPALRAGRTIVAGNSSGSIPAAYFCCHDFSAASVRHAEERLRSGNRDAVRKMERVDDKIAKLARGLSTEIDHMALAEFVAFALGVADWRDAGSIDAIVRRSTVRPRFPCLIVACNKEVIEDVHPDGGFTPGQLKEIDYDTLTVSWKPEVHDWYLRHPDRFRRDHPDLVLTADRRIGRAVTFFVDRSMYDLLARIPPEERQADLRLMLDPADVALAILASASEPTYFPAVPDPRPARILPAAGGTVLDAVRRRTYYGGYIISLPAQDVRRMLPGIRVLGTGWRHNPLFARTLLKNWLLADCERVAFLAEWWADMEVNPDREFISHMENRDTTGDEEFAFGLRRAREVFDRDACLPAFVHRPRFDRPAAAAIVSPDTPHHPDAPLPTLRGLGPLLAPADNRAAP